MSHCHRPLPWLLPLQPRLAALQYLATRALAALQELILQLRLLAWWRPCLWQGRLGQWQYPGPLHMPMGTGMERGTGKGMGTAQRGKSKRMGRAALEATGMAMAMGTAEAAQEQVELLALQGEEEAAALPVLQQLVQEALLVRFLLLLVLLLAQAEGVEEGAAVGEAAVSALLALVLVLHLVSPRVQQRWQLMCQLMRLQVLVLALAAEVVACLWMQGQERGQQELLMVRTTLLMEAGGDASHQPRRPQLPLRRRRGGALMPTGCRCLPLRLHPPQHQHRLAGIRARAPVRVLVPVQQALRRRLGR